MPLVTSKTEIKKQKLIQVVDEEGKLHQFRTISGLLKKGVSKEHVVDPIVQLGLMMEKVSRHFQDMHKAVIDQMKSLMEPMMMIVLAGIVAVILLSIVTPMFSIYSQIE